MLAERFLIRQCKAFDPDALLVPGIDEGFRGMRFIEAAVRSNVDRNSWQTLD